MNKDYDVIVIGAGAAGLIAAGHVGELGGEVLLLEKMEQAGRKLRITGKGRCNISNDSSHSDYFKNIYPNGRFLKHAFGRFFSADIVKLLNDYGVPTATERGNRIFPISNNSVDVFKALMKWIGKYKIDISYKTKVEKLLIAKNKIQGVRVIIDGKNKEIYCKKVILCTGGKSYPATGSTGDGYKLAHSVGHSIEDLRPALVPLVSSGNMAGSVQGLALKNVNAVVWVDGKKSKEEFGELLFTHFGLSVPIILTLSRFVVDELNKKSNVEISIDLKPALNEQKLDARLLRDLNANGKKNIANIFKLWLPAKLIPVFIKQLGIDGKKEGHQINAKERHKIMLLLKNLRFKIIDHRGFKEAVITAGGISTNEIDSKTMQSRLIQNLYFAGEVINVDGNTGGYNLQIANSTAWLAAEACMSNI